MSLGKNIFPVPSVQLGLYFVTPLVGNPTMTKLKQSFHRFDLSSCFSFGLTSVA